MFVYILPESVIPEMTYTVSGGTLKPTFSLTLHLLIAAWLITMIYTVTCYIYLSLFGMIERLRQISKKPTGGKFYRGLVFETFKTTNLRTLIYLWGLGSKQKLIWINQLKTCKSPKIDQVWPFMKTGSLIQPKNSINPKTHWVGLKNCFKTMLFGMNIYNIIDQTWHLWG